MGNVVESPVEKVVKLLNELRERQRAEQNLTELEIYALREAASWLQPNLSQKKVLSVKDFDLSEQNL